MVQRILLVARSGAVGALATLVDLAALAVLIELAGLPTRVASLPALALGIGVQFVGNKLFAFGDRSPRWLEQGGRFLAVEALACVLNLALFDLAIRLTPLPYLLARMLTTAVVYFAVCLPLWSRIFRAELRPEEGLS